MVATWESRTPPDLYREAQVGNDLGFFVGCAQAKGQFVSRTSKGPPQGAGCLTMETNWLIVGGDEPVDEAQIGHDSGFCLRCQAVGSPPKTTKVRKIRRRHLRRCTTIRVDDIRPACGAARLTAPRRSGTSLAMALRPHRQAAAARQPHHPQPTRAHERHVVRHCRPAVRGVRAGRRRTTTPGPWC